ncbi:hypothetical protein P9869_02805 [Streptomyces ossamyceticus]|nr:hypothetical protein [Streptomyces ossamyceticus]
MYGEGICCGRTTGTTASSGTIRGTARAVSQRFRIERAEGTVKGTKGTKGAWRLRPRRGDADVCVGMRGGPEEKGAVAVAEGCADATGAGGAGDAQLLLIGRHPTGRE